jgi:hypothetical protein
MSTPLPVRYSIALTKEPPAQAFSDGWHRVPSADHDLDVFQPGAIGSEAFTGLVGGVTVQIGGYRLLDASQGTAQQA